MERIRGRLAAVLGSAGQRVRSAVRLPRLRLGSAGERLRSAGRLGWGDATSDAAAADTTPMESTASRLETFRERGRLRRRLGYLRRARELGYRDLGGLLFDMRRFDRDRPDLVEAKLVALTEVDRELRALEETLGTRELVHDLREPGVASCPRCATLHGSDARFCPGCGLQLSGPRTPHEASEADS